MPVWIAAACAILFFMQDQFLRFGAAARSNTAQSQDQRSTSLNTLGIFAAAFAAFALPALLPGDLGRMASEEVMLEAAFGEQYREYRRRVRRVVPFIY